MSQNIPRGELPAESVQLGAGAQVVVDELKVFLQGQRLGVKDDEGILARFLLLRLAVESDEAAHLRSIQK